MSGDPRSIDVELNEISTNIIRSATDFAKTVFPDYGRSHPNRG